MCTNASVAAFKLICKGFVGPAFISKLNAIDHKEVMDNLLYSVIPSAYWVGSAAIRYKCVQWERKFKGLRDLTGFMCVRGLKKNESNTSAEIL